MVRGRANGHGRACTRTASSATSPPSSCTASPTCSATSTLDVRITNRQNLVFRGLTEEQLPGLYERLTGLGMAVPGRRAGPRRGGLPGRRHLQPRRDPVPRARRRHRPGPRGRRARRGRRGAGQHLGLHEQLRAAPHRRHRLLRPRAPRPRPGRARLPDAARRPRRRDGDPVRRQGRQAARQHRGERGGPDRRALRRASASAGETFPDWLARSGGASAVGETAPRPRRVPRPRRGPRVLRRLRRDRPLRQGSRGQRVRAT